ncbi:unnamed protein product [Closterium sp. NIES-53]
MQLQWCHCVSFTFVVPLACSYTGACPPHFPTLPPFSFPPHLPRLPHPVAPPSPPFPPPYSPSGAACARRTTRPSTIPPSPILPPTHSFPASFSPFPPFPRPPVQVVLRARGRRRDHLPQEGHDERHGGGCSGQSPGRDGVSEMVDGVLWYVGAAVYQPCATINRNKVMMNVTGGVAPGNLLAVMGGEWDAGGENWEHCWTFAEQVLPAAHAGGAAAGRCQLPSSHFRVPAAPHSSPHPHSPEGSGKSLLLHMLAGRLEGDANFRESIEA